MVTPSKSIMMVKRRRMQQSRKYFSIQYYLVTGLLLFTNLRIFCTSFASQHERDDSDLSHSHSHLTDHELEVQKSEIDFSSIAHELDNTAEEAADLAIYHLTSSLHGRIQTIFQKATTPKCRAKIATHFSYFINAVGSEHSSLPFVDTKFQFREHDACPEEHLDPLNLPKNMTLESFQNRKYQPPRDSNSNSNETQGVYLDNPNDLKIMYGILMHGDHRSTIRLVESLNYQGDDGANANANRTTFVIHVDGKEESDSAYQALVEYAKDKDYVHIIPDIYRVRVNWGGYSMVNATMQIFKHCFGMLDGNGGQLDFHKFIHISASR